jgi:alpha-glucosidase
MFDVLRFWLKRGVNGFRIDAANLIMKDPQWRDNPPNPHGALYHKAFGDYDAQIHLYDRGHTDVHGIFRDLRSLLESYSHAVPRVALGELAISSWQEWASYYGTDLDELHLPFNFGLLGIRWNAWAIQQVVDACEAVVPVGAWPNYVLGNHDERRIASRIGKVQARVGMLLLLTLRGTPTLYYGDELGMRDGEIPRDRRQDPWERTLPGLNLGRDPARTPMQWNASPNAGFCPAEIKPWLPIAPDFEQANVEVQRRSPTSLLSLTRALLTLRRAKPALTKGSYRVVESGSQSCFAYLREEGKQRLLIALNFSAEPERVALSGQRNGHLLIKTSGLFLPRRERRGRNKPFLVCGRGGAVAGFSPLRENIRT